MNLNANIGMFASPGIGGRFGRQDTAGQGAQKGSTIFVGNLLNQSQQFDPIAQKRASAQKQAYKVVGDTFAGERKIDDDLKGRADHAKQLRQEMGEAKKQIKAIDAQKDELRQSYGIAKDSQEQKDLELLEKRKAYQNGDLSSELSSEEWERSFELDKQGYTEYQKQALELDAYKAPYEKTVSDAQKGIIEENAIIRATDLERLKRSPMLKATKEAEEILAQASDEIIGMLLDEAKDHIDEKMEEEQEKAEERKEEEEEKQEKLEAAKEHREQMEALAGQKPGIQEPHASPDASVMTGDAMTENILKLEELQNDVKQEVEDIMQKMNLVAEDMKGIQVDALL